MKRIIGKQVLLAYPDFSKEFVIHTDASRTQLRAVISQDGTPIAFYSLRGLKPEQTRYTTTERATQYCRDSQGVSKHLARPSDCGSHQSQEPHLQELQHRTSYAMATPSGGIWSGATLHQR
jgi:RNase H-like domain found in reverse transcriptase